MMKSYGGLQPQQSLLRHLLQHQMRQLQPHRKCRYIDKLTYGDSMVLYDKRYKHEHEREWEEHTMTRPIPPDILARLEAHVQWRRIGKEEGQQLAVGNLDLHDLDLSE